MGAPTTGRMWYSKAPPQRPPRLLFHLLRVGPHHAQAARGTARRRCVARAVAGTCPLEPLNLGSCISAGGARPRSQCRKALAAKAASL